MTKQYFLIDENKIKEVVKFDNKRRLIYTYSDADYLFNENGTLNYVEPLDDKFVTFVNGFLLTVENPARSVVDIHYRSYEFKLADEFEVTGGDDSVTVYHRIYACNDDMRFCQFCTSYVCVKDLPPDNRIKMTEDNIVVYDPVVGTLDKRVAMKRGDDLVICLSEYDSPLIGVMRGNVIYIVDKNDVSVYDVSYKISGDDDVIQTTSMSVDKIISKGTCYKTKYIAFVDGNKVTLFDDDKIHTICYE